MKTNGKNANANGSQANKRETENNAKKLPARKRCLTQEVVTVGAEDRAPGVQGLGKNGEGGQPGETDDTMAPPASNGRNGNGGRGRSVKGNNGGRSTTKRVRYKDPVKLLRDVSGRTNPHGSEGRTYGESIAIELFELALQNSSLTAKMTAIREIHDRLSGKAKPLAEVQIPRTEIQMYEEAVAATIQDGADRGLVISREEAVRMVCGEDTYISDSLSKSEPESGKRE